MSYENQVNDQLGQSNSFREQYSDMFYPVNYWGYMYNNSPPNVETFINTYPNYTNSQNFNPIWRNNFNPYQENYHNGNIENMPKVFIYARRSSTKNKETSVSIEKQIEILTNFSWKCWFNIINVFKDNASWFKANNRDDFTRMLEEIETRNLKAKNPKNQIDYVLVYTASRLSRNREEANKIANLVEDEHLRIMAIDKQYPDTNAWKESLIHDLNKEIFFSKKLSTEGKVNMDRTYMKGTRFPRNPPYGYRIDWRKDNSRVVVDDYYKASELVVKIFEYYSTWDYTYLSLANKLNEEWYQFYTIVKWEFITRKIEWPDIHRVIRKEIYYWKIVVEYKNLKREEIAYFEWFYEWLKIEWNSVVIDYTEAFKNSPTFRPLIDRDLFLKCKNLRTKKHTWWKQSKENSEWALFKGILKCMCGHRLEDIITGRVKLNKLISYTADIKHKKNNTYYYWRCSHWSMKHKCLLTKNITQTELLWFIKDNVFSKLHLDAEIRKEILMYIRAFTKDVITKQLDNVQDATRKLRQLMDEKEWYLKRYLEANTTSMQWILWKELENKIKEIEELEKYIKKLKESQSLAYIEVDKWEKLKKDQTFFVVKKDGDKGYMYKNSENDVFDEETIQKHQEMVELERREKFINEKVKEWEDFLYDVEEMIENFSSYPLISQIKIIQFIFDWIIMNNWKIQLVKLNDFFLFLMLLLQNSSIDYIGGYLKIEEFSRTFANSSKSNKMPSLAPWSIVMSFGSPTVNRTQLAGFGILNSNRWTMGL